MECKLAGGERDRSLRPTGINVYIVMTSWLHPLQPRDYTIISQFTPARIHESHNFYSPGGELKKEKLFEISIFLFWKVETKKWKFFFVEIYPRNYLEILILTSGVFTLLRKKDGRGKFMQFPFLGIANNRGSKVAPSSCTRYKYRTEGSFLRPGSALSYPRG